MITGHKLSNRKLGKLWKNNRRIERHRLKGGIFKLVKKGLTYREASQLAHQERTKYGIVALVNFDQLDSYGVTFAVLELVWCF